MMLEVGLNQLRSLNTSSTSPFAPKENAPSEEGLVAKASRLASEKVTSRILKQEKEGVKVKLANEAITRDDYPALVELKVAGRSDRDIARELSTSIEQVKLHSARAMKDYRDGKLGIRNGEAVSEAREIGEEKGADFASQMGGYSASGGVVEVSFSLPSVSVSI